MWQDLQDQSILQIMPALRRSSSSCFFAYYRIERDPRKPNLNDLKRFAFRRVSTGAGILPVPFERPLYWTKKQDVHDHMWQDLQDRSILQIMPALRRSSSSCFFCILQN
jgi:hypothetical protein